MLIITLDSHSYNKDYVIAKSLKAVIDYIKEKDFA